jgi:hypothetical protein
MENKESILSKIKSKYVFNNIMDYCFDYCLKYRLLKYSKNLQNKFDITKIEYQKISSIIKYKLISPEYIIETKNKLMEDLSKNDENTINELMNRIVMTSYKKELKEFFENNIYDYFEIKNEKMVNILIEHSILINKTNVEIRLNEELLNDKKFIKFIEKALNYKSEILFTFITQNENINNNFLQKINELKIYNLPRISIDFPYYKNIDPNNILEFYYNGAMSSNDFKIINNFQNLTHLKLINNMEDFTALINFKNLIYLSIINCPKANILLDTEEIAKNLKYFEFDDEENIKFNFNDKPTENKINFGNLEYLFFNHDIIDFNKSTNIKKLKDNKIELISSKMEFFLNLLLNCRKIEDIDLNAYQLNKINQNRLKLFYDVFKSLSLKSLTISSSFNNEIIFDLLQSKNIAKTCKKIKLYITDLEIIDYLIKNYSILEELEVNIEEKIGKLRINSPNRESIKLLNDNLYKQYESFKPANNFVHIFENPNNKIKKLTLNNSNFKVIHQNIYCYSFSMLIELRLKNIPISVNTLPLFSKKTDIYFSSLEVLIIRILNYVDCFYQLEFKKKTLINNLAGLKNPYDINMNLIENEAIENFSNHINRIPRIQHLVLDFMLPGVKKNILINMLDKILDLKFLNNLSFSINSTSEKKILKNNQLMKLFPKIKQKKIALPSKLNISIDI